MKHASALLFKKMAVYMRNQIIEKKRKEEREQLIAASKMRFKGGVAPGEESGLSLAISAVSGQMKLSRKDRKALNFQKLMSKLNSGQTPLARKITEIQKKRT